MRPLVTGPFSDEISYFFDQQGIDTLAHTARWSGAVQFVHAVAKTPGVAQEDPASLLHHVAERVEAPINSYAPERAKRDVDAAPTFNNTWYAIAYASELTVGTPYSTRLFGEPLTLTLTVTRTLTLARSPTSSSIVPTSRAPTCSQLCSRAASRLGLGLGLG